MSKAIKLKQNVIDDNPNLFLGHGVGQIIAFDPPQRFVRADIEEMNYDQREDLQAIDGVQNVVIPPYNQNIEKLGKLIEKNGEITHEVVPLSVEEIDAKIPLSVPKLYMKLELLEYGVNDDDVIQAIETALQMGIIDEKTKGKLVLKWLQSNLIERKNTNLISMLPLLNQIKLSQNPDFVELTEENIMNIFKNYEGSI